LCGESIDACLFVVDFPAAKMVIGSIKSYSVRNTDRSELLSFPQGLNCVVEFVILFEMQKYALYMIWLNASNYGL